MVNEWKSYAQITTSSALQHSSYCCSSSSYPRPCFSFESDDPYPQQALLWLSSRLTSFWLTKMPIPSSGPTYPCLKVTSNVWPYCWRGIASGNTSSTSQERPCLSFLLTRWSTCSRTSKASVTWWKGRLLAVQLQLIALWTACTVIVRKDSTTDTNTNSSWGKFSQTSLHYACTSTWIECACLVHQGWIYWPWVCLKFTT